MCPHFDDDDFGYDDLGSPVGGTMSLGVLGFKSEVLYPSTPQSVGKRIMRWHTIPSLPFKPNGLIVWGVDETTTIDICSIANEVRIGLPDPVPAIFFATARTYEEIEELAKADKVVLPAWCDFNKCYPSQRALIHTTGPISQLAMWGFYYS